MSASTKATRELTRTTPRSSKTSGFALVTSLLVLVALTSLGIGAYFLTNMNLRIAENARSNAVAYYNAHEGLDVVLIALAQEFQSRGDGKWPDISEVRARLPVDAPYRLLELVMDPVVGGLSPGGTVTVQGQGPRHAQYETGARFEGRPAEFSTPGSGDPMFGTGWITDGDIEINGSTEFSIGLWAGGSIDAAATAVLTIAGFLQAGGSCTIKTIEEVPGHPSSGFECKTGVARPEVPEFKFDEALADLKAKRPVCNYEIDENTTLDLAEKHENSTICVGENVKLTVRGAASGLYILGPKSSTVKFNGVTAGKNKDSDEFGVKVAVGTFEHGNNGFNLNGVNTIYSVESIRLEGKSVKAIGTHVDSDLYVNTFFATEKNFYMKNLDGPFEGIIWTSANVCKQGGGGLSFTGAILAQGEGPKADPPCDKTQGIYWNGGGGGKFTAVDNDDIPESDVERDSAFEAAGILVVAKRP